MSSFNPTLKEQRRQSIFRAAHTVLMGSTVRANDRTAIKALISKYPANFEPVVTMYGSDMVVQIISSLLENGTLGSGSRAHLEIPETRQPSVARDRQHVALEQEVAQSEAKALDEASRSDIGVDEGVQGGEQTDAAEATRIEDTSGSISSMSPSLFPAYLSYTSQHKLLNTVQRVMEDCCYDWAAKWIPFLLEEREWTCSEAVELGVWTATIPQRFDTFSFDATTLGSQEALNTVFLATHPLRHAAVHRLRTSVKGIERMLKNSLNLATALQDTQRKGKLHDILMEFRATMQAMEWSKNDLENQLDEELRNIREQRAALDRKEEGARLGMLRKDRESTARISLLFDNSIKNLTSMDEPHVAGNEQDNAGNPGLKEGCDDKVAGGTPDEHSAQSVHHTTDKAGCEKIDSKPSMHDGSDLSTAESIPDNHNADDDQTATADASCGDGEVMPNNSGDNGASNADSTEATVQPGENESVELPFTSDLDHSTIQRHQTAQ